MAMAAAWTGVCTTVGTGAGPTGVGTTGTGAGGMGCASTRRHASVAMYVWGPWSPGCQAAAKVSHRPPNCSHTKGCAMVLEAKSQRIAFQYVARAATAVETGVSGTHPGPGKGGESAGQGVVTPESHGGIGGITPGGTAGATGTGMGGGAGGGGTSGCSNCGSTPGGGILNGGGVTAGTTAGVGGTNGGGAGSGGGTAGGGKGAGPGTAPPPFCESISRRASGPKKAGSSMAYFFFPLEGSGIVTEGAPAPSLAARMVPSICMPGFVSPLASLLAASCTTFA